MRVKLMEKCEISPKLEGLCSLPINAVIMSFLIHCIESDGPATQTGLYKPFVSNFLLRHLDIRQTVAEWPLIECLLNDVPVEIRDAFQKICSLAYNSSLEGTQLFTKKELGQSDVAIDNTGSGSSTNYYVWFRAILQILPFYHSKSFWQPFTSQNMINLLPLKRFYKQGSPKPSASFLCWINKACK